MMVGQCRTLEMATTKVAQMADKALEEARINRLLREADEFVPDIRNRLEQKLMEQRLDEARAAMSLVEEEAKEYRLEMMRLRQLTWMNEYLVKQSDKLVYSLAGLRLEEAMVDMEIDHEIGYKTNIKAGLVLDEVCLKKQKTWKNHVWRLATMLVRITG